MKINQLFLALATSLFLFGCSENNIDNSSSKASSSFINDSSLTSYNDNSSNETSNSLSPDISSTSYKEETNTKVIYFSCTNTTEKIAYKISNYLECNIEEIIPLIPYSDEDLNYNNNSSRANIEQNDANARPEIENTINLDDTDVIFLGYPIW